MEQYEKMYLYKRIVQAKLFIDNHYAEDIDLNNIAHEAYFSKFHFVRLFKSIYGKTPHLYLTSVRINKAKELLKKNMAVLDVCLSVGFDSPTSFTAVFKRNTGSTPSAFQNGHRIRKQQINDEPLSVVPNCFTTTYGWAKK
ncbi:MAG TPA: AraC family transcriptional regulator [Cyclobacteriaceae bacterium]|jgi:AraC-like DNA-binding protein|nr:AraC family transcriptional regulator [Cyclobacteriaceae bacterium]